METKSIGRRDLLKMLAALGVAGTEIDVALAQSKSNVDQLGGKIVFQNEKVRVIEHLARPRLGVCGPQMHSHPPHMTIALTAVKAKVTLQGKEPFLVENKAGDVFWDPGGPHMVENVGKTETKVYLVELKAA